MKKILLTALVFAGITATAQVKVGNNPTTLATNAQFQVEGTTAATDQFVVLKNVNVGIGTTAPTAKLDVNATSGIGAIIRNNGAYNSEGTNNLKLLNLGGDLAMHLGVDGATGVGYIQAMQPGVSWSTRALVFQANGGNVGIGTTAPAQKLTVTHPSQANAEVARFSVNGNSGADQGISTIGISQFINVTNPGVSISAIENGTGNYDASMVFSTNGVNSDVAPIERMRISPLGNVGIGTTAPNGKLHVVATTGISGYFTNNGASSNGVYAVNSGATSNAVVGISSGVGSTGGSFQSTATSGSGTAVYAYCVSGNGVVASAATATGGNGGVFYGGGAGHGLYAQGYSNFGYGLYGKTQTSTYAGVIGYNHDNSTYGMLGFGTYGLYVSGSTWCTSGTWAGSDRRLKTNIVSVENGLKTVMALNPVSYDKRIDFKSDKYDLHETGFIAQEVQKLMPHAVREAKGPNDTEAMLGVNYIEIIPVLTKAIQEQQAQIEALKAEVAKLKK